MVNGVKELVSNATGRRNRENSVEGHKTMARAGTRHAEAVSASNRTGDPSQSLQTFDLVQLQQYTQEKAYSPTASKDFHLFFVGRDDVHDILKYVLSRVRVSPYLNMFGYDDDELNDILMAKALVRHDAEHAGQESGWREARKGVAGRRSTARVGCLQHLLRDRSIVDTPDQPYQGLRSRWQGGRRRIGELVHRGGRHLRRHGKVGRTGLQGAKQYTDDLHRSRLGQPISDGTDCGTYDR
jgi:hypothetical protein